MKPDWDDLGEKYEKSKKVLIGDVDCTVETNKKLCEDHGVKGYPTIKYYTPGDRAGEVYEGERDLKSLKAHAEEKLVPMCSPAKLELCDDEKKAQIVKFQAMSAADLDKLIETESAKIKEAEKAQGIVENYALGVVNTFCAAAGASVVTNPIDVVKTRLQVAGANPEIFGYTGFIDCFVKLVKAEGLAALFAGVSGRFKYLGPGFAIWLPTYDLLKRLYLGKQ